MIENRPDWFDYQAYEALPDRDRWVMNKLQVAESLGYRCGPSGAPIPEGTWCVRPIMNLTGNGNPGFFKVEVGPNGVGNQPNVPGGYFWCEWFEGESAGVDYELDQPVHARGGTPGPDGNIPYGPLARRDILPPQFRGIARFLTVEYIGDKIIEVTPRWQWLIDGMEKVQNPDGSFRWRYENERPQTGE